MWAYGCGVVATGQYDMDRWLFVVGGILLAGPLVCGTSQAVNDWFDRHVDAINQPERVIPSGRMPGALGSRHRRLQHRPFAFGGMGLGRGSSVQRWSVSLLPGPTARRRSGSSATGGSAMPRVGLCYEGLPWFTAAAAALGGFPGWPILTLCFSTASVRTAS